MVPYVSEYRFLLSVAPGFESKLDFFLLGQSEFFCIRITSVDNKARLGLCRWVVSDVFSDYRMPVKCGQACEAFWF